MKNKTPSDKLMFSLLLNSSKFEENGKILKLPEIEGISEDYMFEHLVLTDGVYNHGWYGRIRYTFEAMSQMVDNHVANVLKEDCYLRCGHASWFGGDDDSAYGWYLKDKDAISIISFNTVDNKGRKAKKYGLIVGGHYNKKGYESVVENMEYKYLSSEIYNNYREREITESLQEKIDKGIGLDELGDDEELYKSEEYGFTWIGAGLTNTPFFHLPKLSEVSNIDIASEFSQDNFDTHHFVSENVVLFDNDYYLRVGKRFVNTKDLNDTDKELAQIIEGIPKEKTSVPIFSFASEDFSAFQIKDVAAISFNTPNGFTVGGDDSPTTSDVHPTTGPETPDDHAVPYSGSQIDSGDVAPNNQKPETFKTEDEESKMDKLLLIFALSNRAAVAKFESENADLSEVERSALDSVKQKFDLEEKVESGEKNFAQFKEAAERKLQEERQFRIEAQNREYSLSVDAMLNAMHDKGAPKFAIDHVRSVFDKVPAGDGQKQFSFGDSSVNIVAFVNEIVSGFDFKKFTGPALVNNETEAAASAPESAPVGDDNSDNVDYADIAKSLGAIK